MNGDHRRRPSSTSSKSSDQELSERPSDNDNGLLDSKPPASRKRRVSFASVPTAATVDPRPQRQRNDILCSFCQQQPAAVEVIRRQKSLNKQRNQLQQHRQRPGTEGEFTHYCLVHYYTTSAVRLSTDELIAMEANDDATIDSYGNKPPRKSPKTFVRICNQTVYDEQLPGIQELFQEAFVELQQALAEESARSFAANAKDPLGALLQRPSSSQQKKRRLSSKLKDPPPSSNNNNINGGGGFIQKMTLPERFRQTQAQQQHLQEQLKRQSSSYAARRPSQKSNIWNVVIDESQTSPSSHQNKKKNKTTTKKSSPNNPYTVNVSAPILAVDAVCSTCGPDNPQGVEQLTHNQSRSMGMTKGETWGNKDRQDEITNRYQCLQCGKVWNEQE